MESAKQQVTGASSRLAEIILESSRKGGAIHHPTAIVSAGYLAGTTVLRASAVDLRSRRSGELVESEWVLERVAEHLMLMRGLAAQAGIGRDGGWKDPIPREHRPLRSMFDILQELDPQFRRLMFDMSVPHELHAAVASRAAVDFIVDFRVDLQVDVGKALAYTALVKAARTVPPNDAAVAVAGRGRGRPWWRFW